VDDKEQDTRSNFTKGDVALLLIVEFVPPGESKGVLEYDLSGLEIDGVFSEVEQVFPLIVFESHRSLQSSKFCRIYIQMSIQFGGPESLRAIRIQ